MKRGFRGQAIYLVQSPPILMSHCVGRVPRLKASDVGNLGGISRLKRIYEDLCVHGSPAWERAGVRVND
jgi:hypothetical protein